MIYFISKLKLTFMLCLHPKLDARKKIIIIIIVIIIIIIIIIILKFS